MKPLSSMPISVLPVFALSSTFKSVYLYFRIFQAAMCFEKVLKAITANYKTMKILGSLNDPEKLNQAKVCMIIVKKNKVRTWWEYSHGHFLTSTENNVNS